MRVTSNMYTDLFTSETQNLQRQQLQAQHAISSGQRFQTVSDDPSAFRQSLQIQASQRERLQFRDNVREVKTRMEITHGYAVQAHDVVSRASELLTRVNSTYTQTELNITANELDGLLREAINIGNAQHDGQFLFGGTGLQPSDSDGAAAYVPFRTTIVGSTIASVTYRGNFVTNQVQIDSNAQISSNLLGESSGLTPRGLFTTSAVNLFADLIVIRDQLLAGNTTGTTGNIINLNRDEESIATVIGLTASDLSRLKISEATHDDRLQNDELSVSRLLDTDFTKSATDLQRSLTAYQAALQTGARVMNTNLLDFI